MFSKIAVTFAKKIFKRWNLNQFTQNSELDTKTPSDRPGNIFFYNSKFWPPWLRNFILKMNFPKVNTEFGPTISRGGGRGGRDAAEFRKFSGSDSNFGANLQQKLFRIVPEYCWAAAVPVPRPYRYRYSSRIPVDLPYSSCRSKFSNFARGDDLLQSSVV